MTAGSFPVVHPGGKVTPAPHPGSDYYVNLVTGSVQRQSNATLALYLQLAGYAGPFTWAVAQDVARNHSGILSSTPSATAGMNTSAIGQGQQAIGGSAGVADFLSRLTQANTWLRIAEVVAGGILVIVAVNAALKSSPTANAAVNTTRSGLKKTAKVIGAIPK